MKNLGMTIELGSKRRQHYMSCFWLVLFLQLNTGCFATLGVFNTIIGTFCQETQARATSPNGCKPLQADKWPRLQRGATKCVFMTQTGSDKQKKCMFNHHWHPNVAAKIGRTPQLKNSLKNSNKIVSCLAHRKLWKGGFLTGPPPIWGNKPQPGETSESKRQDFRPFAEALLQSGETVQPQLLARAEES